MSVGSVLRAVGEALDASEIPWMVAGSVASSLWGEVRSTQGIDIVVLATRDSLVRLCRALPEERWYADVDMAIDAARRQAMFNVVDLETGWKVDLILRKGRGWSVGRKRWVSRRSWRGCGACDGVGPLVRVPLVAGGPVLQHNRHQLGDRHGGRCEAAFALSDFDRSEVAADRGGRLRPAARGADPRQRRRPATPAGRRPACRAFSSPSAPIPPRWRR